MCSDESLFKFVFNVYYTCSDGFVIVHQCLLMKPHTLLGPGISQSTSGLVKAQILTKLLGHLYALFPMNDGPLSFKFSIQNNQIFMQH